MSCYKCVRKDYCPYIHYFNHDKSIGCIDFQDRDYTTYITNTLNVRRTKMSEELKALENIKHYDSRVGLHKNDYEIIEYALNQLEVCKKCNEQLAKQVKENEINVKTLKVLQEGFEKMDEKEKDRIEMIIYHRMCGSCPNAKMCHEECETCEEYDEVLACALGEDYDN